MSSVATRYEDRPMRLTENYRLEAWICWEHLHFHRVLLPHLEIENEKVKIDITRCAAHPITDESLVDLPILSLQNLLKTGEITVRASIASKLPFAAPNSIAVALS
jgi:hypothetical protein